MANINIKGIWIPVQILLNQELNDKEKIILSLILFFSREKNCCDIRNEQFSELVLVKEDRVSRLVSSLKEKGYLNVKYNYKEESKKITSRVIMPIAEKIGCYNDLMGIVENDNKDSSKHQPPIGENAKDIKNNNKLSCDTICNTQVIEVNNCVESPKNNTNNKININTSSLDELKKIPGIGESKAKSIIEYREKNKFNSIEDIKNVNGIGESLYENIKEYIEI